MGSLQDFFAQILNTLNITENFNVWTVASILLLSIVGEASLQIPWLMETVWLVLGYQVSSAVSPASISNLLVAFLVAQAGRQIGISGLFYLLMLVTAPLAKPCTKLFQRNKYCRKYLEKKDFYEGHFLSVTPATLGMMTPLNVPIKVMLVMRRKLRVLLVGTLLSGMSFDALYIVMGAVFGTTTLKLTYLPICLLVGFLSYLLLKVKVLRWVSTKNTSKGSLPGEIRGDMESASTRKLSIPGS